MAHLISVELTNTTAEMLLKELKQQKQLNYEKTELMASIEEALRQDDAEENEE